VQQYAPTLQRVLLFGLFFVLIYLGFSILKYFIVPVLWAAIIAYMTWPVYLWVQRRFFGENRPTLNATIMISLVILVIGVPFICAIFMLQLEGRNLYFNLQRQLFSGHIQIPDFIKNLPVVGKDISRTVNELSNDPNSITKNFVLSEISRNLVKLTFAIMTLFFFYRDGQMILAQVSRAMEMVIGPRVHHYLDTISETTRAVVYGVGLTAVAQALLAGLSYFVAGIPNPMLLTMVTFILALIPFGTPVSYLGVGLWLFAQGQTVEAIGVIVWGLLIVSSSDNVIRPLVISGATQIPFLLIMFGVLGGIASFGLVGLFIGPVILAILLAIWREWLHENVEEPVATLETPSETK
jgi:predicted PurR-regulated permease PerM